MKILFLTEKFYPDCDANGNCVKNIVKSMAQQGHECMVLCSASQKTDFITQTNEKYKIALFHYDNHISKEQAFAALKSNFWNGLCLFGKVLQRRIALQYSPAHIRWFAAWAFKKRLLFLLTKEKFDAVVCAFFPVEYAFVCADLTRKGILACPYFVYQVDTYVTNSTLAPCFQKLRSKVLRQIYNYAKGAFITPFMNTEVEAIGDNALNAHKIEIIEFPNFTGNMRTETVCGHSRQTKTDEIRCVYAGSLYQKIRNPDYTFQLFGALSQIGVHLYVYGSCDYDLEKSKAKYFGNVHFLGRIPTEEYFHVIQNADVLVNIGNRDITQFPSKLFDYFATGNPIINVCKTAACPTRRYLAQYPVGIDIIESLSNFDENVKLLTEFFIKRNFINQVPMATLKAKFKSCTPDFVAEQMLAVIASQCR